MLVLADRHLFLTAKLVDFSLTPGEWADYRLSTLKGSTANPALRDLASFEDFYRQADARDAAMADKFLSLYRSPHTTRGLRFPVLITGGYHAGGITGRLTKAGLAVASFVPRIEKLEGPQGAAALTIFSQEKTPLEKLFEGEKLFLAPEPIKENVAEFEAPAEIAASEARFGSSARDVMGRLAPVPVLNKITRIVQTVKAGESTVTFWFSRGGASLVRTLSSEAGKIRFFWKAQERGLIPLNLLREQLFILPAFCLAVATFLLFGMHSPWAIPAAWVAGIAGLLAGRNPFLGRHPALKAAEFGVSPESYKTVVDSGYWFFGLATISATIHSLTGFGGVELVPLATLLIRDGILTGIGAHFLFNLVSPIPAMGFWPTPKGSKETLSVSIGKYRHLILRDSRTKIAAHLEVSSEKKEHQDLLFHLPAGQAALFLPAHSETPWAWNTIASEPARVEGGYRGVEMTLQAGDPRQITIDLPKMLLLNVVSLRMQLFYGRSIREEEKRFLAYLKGLPPGTKKALQELMPSPLEDIIEPRIYFVKDRGGVIRGVEILKTTYDGRKHYRVFIDLLNAEQATLTANGELQVEGNRPIEIRFRMDSDVDPLTPLPFEKIFTLKARRAMAGDRSFRDSAERFAALVYEEKLLAGSWMYPSYFGRDTLVAARLMWPALTPAVKATIIQSVLNRLGRFSMEGAPEVDGWVAVSDERNGEYLFHEAVVEFNRLMEAGREGAAVDLVRRALSGPRDLPEYHVLDGNALLTGLLSRFLLELEPSEKQRFLETRNARGESNLDSVLAHANVLLHLSRPYVDAFQKLREEHPSESLAGLTKLNDFHRTALALVRIQPDSRGQSFIGNWRDSSAALGFGKYPADLNAFLIPSALASLEEILDSLGRTSSKMTERVGERNWPLLKEALDGRVVLGRARDAWSTAKAHFQVAFPKDEVRRRLSRFLAWEGHSPENRKRLGRRLLAPGISVKDFVTDHGDPPWLKGGFSFTAVALDGEGHPVPIVHSDEVFTLLDNTLPAPETRRLVDFWSRPFPLGLWSEAGVLISNPALADNPYLWEVLGRQAYHGTVVWGWVTAALGLGWARQFKNAENPADREKILQALGDFLSLRRLLGPLAFAEAWSWDLEEDGRMTPSPLVHGIEPKAAGQPAVPIQLWSASAFSVDPNLEEAAAQLRGGPRIHLNGPKPEGVWQRLQKTGDLSPRLLDKWRLLKEDARQIVRDRRARIPRHRRQLQELAARGPPGGIRVAFLHFTAPPRVSGVDIVMTEQARWLARAGIPVRVVAGNRSSEFDSVSHLDYVGIEGLSSMEEWEIDQNLEKVLNNQDVVVVHNVLSVPMNLALTASLHRYITQHPEKHFIVFVHNAMEREEVHYPLSLMNPNLFLPQVTYVTVSKAYREVIARSYPRSPPFQVVPPALWAYNPDYLTTEAAEEFSQNGLFTQDLVMLLPTRVDWNKDIPKALQITEALARRRPKTKLILVVPGVSSFEDLLRETRANRDAGAADWLDRTMRKVAEKHVVFLDATRISGFRRHRQYISDLVVLSDVLLMPSRMESFGMPAIEAASVRTVVAATDLAPHKETMGNGSPLFSIDDSPDLIADRLLAYMDRHSPRDLGPQQRNVIERFEWDNVMADKFIPVLENAIESLPRVGTAVLLHRRGEGVRAYEHLHRIFHVLASSPGSWRDVIGETKMGGVAEILLAFRSRYHVGENPDLAVLRGRFVEPALAALARGFPSDMDKIDRWLGETARIVSAADLLMNDHRHTVALNTLGEFHLLSGRWEEARTAYEESRRIDPQNHDAWAGLAALEERASHQTNGKGASGLGGVMFWLLRVWNLAVPARFQMGEESWQQSAFLTEGLFSVSLGVFLTAAWAAVTGDDGHLPNLLAGSVLGVFVGGHFVDLLTGDRSRAPPNMISAFLIAGLSASPLLWGAPPAVVVPLFFAVHHAVNRFLRWPRFRQGFLSIDKKAVRAVFLFAVVVFSPLLLYFGILAALLPFVFHLPAFEMKTLWLSPEALGGLGSALILATRKSDLLEALRQAYQVAYSGSNPAATPAKWKGSPSPSTESHGLEGLEESIFVWPSRTEWPRVVALLGRQTAEVLDRLNVGSRSVLVSVGPGGRLVNKGQPWGLTLEDGALRRGATVHLFERNPVSFRRLEVAAETNPSGHGKIILAQEARDSRGLKGTADVVMAFSVIASPYAEESDRRETLHRMVEMLRPGGILLIGWYNRNPTYKENSERLLETFTREGKGTLTKLFEGNEPAESILFHGWVGYEWNPGSSRPPVDPSHARPKAPRETTHTGRGAWGDGLKSLGLGLIFFLSLGLIHDGRAESVGPFAPENGVDGLVSFSAGPDAETEEEEQPEGIVSQFLRNRGLQSEKDLWPLVIDWSREVLLGPGPLEERILNLSPLESYVLLDILSRQDPTIPMGPTTTAHVRAQLLVNILSELDREIKSGPAPEDTSLYGPILNLILHDGEGLGRRAFFAQVVRSEQQDALFRLIPDSLKGLLSVRMKESSSRQTSPPAGLLPFIGRPVFDGLTRWMGLKYHHLVAAGIAGFAEQVVLVGGAGVVAEWIGVGTWRALLWLVLSTGFLWKSFPISHGEKGLFFDKAWIDEGWFLKESYIFDQDRRLLRLVSHWFFGPFLVISLVPFILPFLGIPVLGSPQQWLVGGAFVSSLIHGLYNSFFPFYGKVAALGGGAKSGVGSDVEAANVEFLAVVAAFAGGGGNFKGKDLASTLEWLLPRPGSLEVESLDVRAIRALRRGVEAVCDSTRGGSMKKALEVKFREEKLSRPDVASALRMFTSLGSGTVPVAGPNASVPVFLSAISGSDLPALDRLMKSHQAAYALAESLGVPPPQLLLTAADDEAQRVLAGLVKLPAGIVVLAPSSDAPGTVSAARLEEGFLNWRANSPLANTPLAIAVGLPAGYEIKGLESLQEDSPIKNALETLLGLLGELRPSIVDFSNWLELSVLVSKQA
ncbi:MAG: glycosyltransferase [Elusimicrobia bacterium]|nr:glycosyltransferase [Elusimicrobiota bacterium]